MILFGNNKEFYDTTICEQIPAGWYDYLTDTVTFSEFAVFKTNERKRQEIRDKVRAQLLPNINGL